MSKKQTWRLIVKKTGEVIIKDHRGLKEIKDKSLELIKSGLDSKHQIQYFENHLLKETVELADYFDL